jgi:pyruvate formate lyase activating enzyme
MKKALFFETKEDEVVQCHLCNHHCTIKQSQHGICGVRTNIAGDLFATNYGKLVAEHVDPIEKKPLYHFLPGSLAYSIATVGCNFKCDFCQNWQISQVAEAQNLGVPTNERTPQEVIERALITNCKSISYTYTEPTIFFEFAYDCAVLAKEKGLKNNFVTNGYMTTEALEYIAPYLDAANVDLKSFRDEFYQTMCKGRLQPVLDNIKKMKELGIWVEVTTLIIPGKNDSKEELSDIATFLASVDKDIPWHISRFHPDYRVADLKDTPKDILEEAKKIGEEKGLNYIYIGNILTDSGGFTYCPGCKKVVIERAGFFIRENHVKNSKCSFCNHQIKGVDL